VVTPVPSTEVSIHDSNTFDDGAVFDD